MPDGQRRVTAGWLVRWDGLHRDQRDSRLTAGGEHVRAHPTPNRRNQMKDNLSALLAVVAICIAFVLVVAIVQTQLTERAKFEHGYVQQLAQSSTYYQKVWTKPDATPTR